MHLREILEIINLIGVGGEKEKIWQRYLLNEIEKYCDNLGCAYHGKGK